MIRRLAVLLATVVTLVTLAVTPTPAEATPAPPPGHHGTDCQYIPHPPGGFWQCSPAKTSLGIVRQAAPRHEYTVDLVNCSGGRTSIVFRETATDHHALSRARGTYKSAVVTQVSHIGSLNLVRLRAGHVGSRVSRRVGYSLLNCR